MRLVDLARSHRLYEEARKVFAAIRWSDNGGEPHCPACGCVANYAYASRPIFKCKGCDKQFSVTSGELFASRKLPLRDYLAAIAIFVNGAKGHSALQLSRDLDCQVQDGFRPGPQAAQAMGAQRARSRSKAPTSADT